MNVPQDVIGTIIFLITLCLFFSFWLNIALSYKMRSLYQKIKELENIAFISDEELIALNAQNDIQTQQVLTKYNGVGKYNPK
tara:strand:+ start:3611 stop:3856 length:246 start_codon:yes stop_codon:yes gene_type:complete